MTRQHALIIGALVILLLVIGLPFMGGDGTREQVDDSELSEPAAPLNETRQVEPPPLPAPIVDMEPEPEPETELVPESLWVEFPELLAEPATEPGQPESETAEPALPPLNESDSFVTQQLQAMESPTPLTDFLASSQLVRKGVMLVDNMSRGGIPPRDRPLQGLTEEIQVRQIGEERWVMEESSYRRFDNVVNAFSIIETEQMLALYERAAPLLEEAYAELGYPDRQFNEALLQAITQVLNASIPEGPFELRLPSVHYEFADARLESLSRVEKVLIRMGPDNARKVKEKLQSVRQGLLERQQEEAAD